MKVYFEQTSSSSTFTNLGSEVSNMAFFLTYSCGIRDSNYFFKRERDRERETERETETETERQTDRQTDRQTERQTDRDREADRQIQRERKLCPNTHTSGISRPKINQ